MQGYSKCQLKFALKKPLKKGLNFFNSSLQHLLTFSLPPLRRSVSHIISEGVTKRMIRPISHKMGNFPCGYGFTIFQGRLLGFICDIPPAVEFEGFHLAFSEFNFELDHILRARFFIGLFAVEISVFDIANRLVAGKRELCEQLA